jgi:acylphosphatase
MDDAAGRTRIDAVVVGRVQGVAFRYSTHREALRRGLVGWVANASDGSVRVVAEGAPVALEGFVAWLEQGPPAAGVRRLDVTWSKASGGFADFFIRTAP